MKKPIDREQAISCWLENSRTFDNNSRGVFVGPAKVLNDPSIKYVVSMWRFGNEDDLKLAYKGQSLYENKLVMSFGLSAEAAKILLEELADLHGYDLVPR